MKTKKQKLSLEKFQITKLNNLSYIKGGTGDEPVTTGNRTDDGTDCPQGGGGQQQSQDCPG